MKLADYFEPPHVAAALSAYAAFAKRKDWRLTDKLDLYNEAQVAFDSPASIATRQEAFDRIYRDLAAYWKVFRNSYGPPWSNFEVYDGLTTKCSRCSRASGITLRDATDSGIRNLLLECVKPLKGLKPLKSGKFPWMPVAKFTHFYNPRLFPVYDTEYIWKSILNGAFAREYTAFCTSNHRNPGENGPEFNVTYMWLAGDCVSRLTEESMLVFSEWFRGHVGNHPDPANVKADLQTYWATAFEFIALGAACLEGSIV